MCTVRFFACGTFICYAFGDFFNVRLGVDSAHSLRLYSAGKLFEALSTLYDECCTSLWPLLSLASPATPPAMEDVITNWEKYTVRQDGDAIRRMIGTVGVSSPLSSLRKAFVSIRDAEEESVGRRAVIGNLSTRAPGVTFLCAVIGNLSTRAPDVTIICAVVDNLSTRAPGVTILCAVIGNLSTRAPGVTILCAVIGNLSTRAPGVTILYASKPLFIAFCGRNSP